MINKNELLFVVDENNRPIEPKPRSEVHANGYWHRNSHVWIRNDGGQILCCKRSLKKDSKPGFWEPFCGGHVLAGESYLETAVKECKEELGLIVTEDDLKHFKIFKLERAKEFIQVYCLIWNGDTTELKLEEDEVGEVKWVNISQLRDELITAKAPQWNTFGFEGEILEWVEKI